MPVGTKTCSIRKKRCTNFKPPPRRWERGLPSPRAYPPSLVGLRVASRSAKRDLVEDTGRELTVLEVRGPESEVIAEQLFGASAEMELASPVEIRPA